MKTDIKKILLILFSVLAAIILVFVLLIVQIPLILKILVFIFSTIVFINIIIYINKLFSLHDISIEEPSTREFSKVKTDFINIAAHQLRTPSSAINWITDLLLEEARGKLTDEQVSYLTDIKNNNQLMIHRINLLLDTARLELNTFLIDPQPTNIKSVLKNTLTKFEPTIKNKKLKYKENINKIPDTIIVDTKSITLILEELLANAFTYTPEGGTITLSLELKKPNLSITVTDTGYGIAEEDKSKIFTKLYRAENIKKHDTQGTGLSLYILKLLTEKLGGKIWFDSKLESGTSFYVELPLNNLKRQIGRLDVTL